MEAFVGILVDTLNSMIQKELGLLCGVATDMQKLSSLLSTIKAVLEDAEQKQFTEKAIQQWLQELNVVAHEIDDILDDYATEASRVKDKNSGCFSLMCCPVEGNLVFRHRIGTRMKEILAKFNEIADKQKMFNLSDQKRGSNHFLVDSTATRETGSLLKEPDLVLGRDEEKDEIVKILVNQVRDNQNVSVLPIVGVGGLGKTTLAQLVFSDQRIAKHFELKLWVWVSEDFDVKKIIKSLIESAKGTSAEALRLDPLQTELQKFLTGKRYMVVLDDVWNENPEEWEKLKSVLECGSRGSSIVMTTRMEKVATIMGTLQTRYLLSLSNNLCWSLFRQSAFGHQEAEKYPKLIAIGKEIVKKCGGVPLAAKALGGFLRFKREEAEWNSVKCSELWNLPQDTTHILPALGLSYLNLPVELRSCFAYCAVFPKGSKIEKEEVIHLWMANGLISSNPTMEVEDVGYAVVTELHYRSLFQAVEKDEFGSVLTFEMHDLVHDLARSVMEAKHGGTESKRTMMLRMLDDQLIVAFPITSMRGIDQFSSFLSKCGSLRAFIVSSPSWRPMFTVRNMFTELPPAVSKKYTELPPAVSKKFTELPPAVSDLKHLRHVNLSGSDIVELPNSICDLWNLQILNLNDCKCLRCLPKGMRFLRNLRHLCLQGCGNLTHMPSGIGKLTCLRTLSMVVLGGKKGFRPSELRDLNMLKGRLSIKQLERIEDKKDAEEACLIQKQSLRELYLEWDSERMFQQYNDEEVLEALKPCPNLQRLHIRGFKGSSLFPSWISTITEVAVKESAMEYIVGAQESTTATAAVSPSLKQLTLENMPNLKGMLGREVQGTPGVFSQLQSLSFWDCPMLTLPLPRMPSLKELCVDSCPNMAWASISNLTALKTLTIGDYPKLESLPEEGLRGLASLQELCIRGCHNLVSLSMGTKALKSLTHLRIEWSNATALPEEVKHFPALQVLDLQHFRNLTSLPDWFGDHLTSLQHLTLQDCPKLETLPSSIQMIRHCKV